MVIEVNTAVMLKLQIEVSEENFKLITLFTLKTELTYVFYKAIPVVSESLELDMALKSDNKIITCNNMNYVINFITINTNISDKRYTPLVESIEEKIDLRLSNLLNTLNDILIIRTLSNEILIIERFIFK